MEDQVQHAAVGVFHTVQIAEQACFSVWKWKGSTACVQPHDYGNLKDKMCKSCSGSFRPDSFIVVRPIHVVITSTLTAPQGRGDVGRVGERHWDLLMLNLVTGLMFTYSIFTLYHYSSTVPNKVASECSSSLWWFEGDSSRSASLTRPPVTHISPH